MPSKNQEIRFRVPPHVWDILRQQTENLGYPTSAGVCSGPSTLARRVLYQFLGLDPLGNERKRRNAESP